MYKVVMKMEPFAKNEGDLTVGKIFCSFHNFKDDWQGSKY
jgi:hypothetical protein